MKKKLLEKNLEKLSKQGALRFHMPGHKGKNILKKENWGALDFTEIPGSDNLHHPEGIIKTVQEKLACIYGSEEACILVNGTTTGLQSAIMGVCREGDSLLIPLNCHRSVFGGLALGRVRGVYFAPESDPLLGVGKRITVEQVKIQTQAHPEVKGMLLVNPTYYGTTSDVKAIAEHLHREGKILIVDEAHGAHLKFSTALPEDAVSAGADIVVQSTHKILGALTQSSLLHFQGDRVDRSRVKRFLSVLQSSSPSYLLMMSVENAVDEAFEKGAAIFGEIATQWDHYQTIGDQGQLLTLYTPEDGSPYDKSKWLFHVGDHKGMAIDEMLRTEYNIQTELSGENHLLAMTGMGTTPEDLEQLMKVVEAINHKIPIRHLENPTQPIKLEIDYEESIPIWEALYNKDSQRIPLEEAENKIAADFVIPYPPGIPVLLPGMYITREMIAYLQSIEGEIIGIDGGIPVIKE